MLPIAPEPIKDLRLKFKRAGNADPNIGMELLLVCESTLLHWGVLQSCETKVFYDGVIASSLRTTNMGVKMYNNEIRVQFEMADSKLSNDPEKYELVVSFEFLADGVVWPDITKAVKK